MDAFVGEIRAVAFPFAPRGWALCNGALLQISSNPALFSLLGIQFGGNGSTTFGLPDLCGRMAVNQGNGPGLSGYAMGDIVGSPTVTVTVDQMPAHAHSPAATAAPGNVSDPKAAVWGSGPVNEETGVPLPIFTNNPPAANLKVMAPQAVMPVGGGTPVQIGQPTLAAYYIIALQGAFPARP